MLQLENQTRFKATFAVLPDRHGVDTLFVVIKATVMLRPKLALAEEQVPVQLADAYYGDPATSSLRLPSDMHIGKPGTDVHVIGSAWAPQGKPVTRMSVAVSVAGRQKTILVTGDRVWRDGRPSTPQPFISMPLVWERAFGGWHRRGDTVAAEERNPVGCGFAGGRSANEMEGTAVPNLDDPSAPVEQLGETPPPACLAPVAPSWLPRRSFAGTYDARWQRSVAPYLPSDFDLRFFQSAIPELTFDHYLQAGAAVQVAGVSADGPIAFAIPDGRLEVAVSLAGATERPPVNLDTLSVEPDNNRACFTWRAALPCDRRPLKVERIVVSRTSAGGTT